MTELARADVTLEWPHPRVNLHVTITVAVTGKRFPTDSTAERSVLEMLRLVQVVLKAVVAREATVAARVASPDSYPSTAVPE